MFDRRGVTGCGRARAANWQPLGERPIDCRNNPETITTSGSEGPIPKMKISVEQDDLEIRKVTVVFGDGRSFDVALNKYIGHGQSRVTDLPSAETIQKLQFTYGKASSILRTGYRDVAKSTGSRPLSDRLT